MTPEEIIGRVKGAGISLVQITGGEPLLQKQDMLILLKNLLDEGYKVLIETNGSLSICGIDERSVIILDVKTPGSGVAGQIDFSNFDCLKPSDEVKFVICSRRDYDWAKDIVARFRLRDKAKVLFSPATGMVQPAELAGWIIHDKLDVRFNLQIHKYIFGPEERGV